jgi:non-canonical purine NTP pyrophosphatase (RdgB/HAM1 family)
MKLSDLVIVTSHPGKLREINTILGINHKVSKIDVPEIQSLDLDAVILAKAQAAYQKIKKPVLVTDVSFEMEALEGLPGTFAKFFLLALGAEKTAKLAKGKSNKAKFTEAIAVYDGKIAKVFKGSVEGTLSQKAKGSMGFGFDTVFIPKGYKQTYAQMSKELKNKISHRAIALNKLKKYFVSSRGAT